MVVQRYQTARRTGGVIGVYDANTWGCLSFTTSGGGDYGGYFTSTKKTSDKQGVGIGCYGDLLGGWARGDVYGFYTSGDRYASYTDGNSFTNGYHATLHDVGGTERVATFTPTSVDVDVYAHGVGQLIDGKSEITFDKDFLELVSEEIPVTVTVTPIGAPAGLLYLTDESFKSFSVELVELPGLKSGSKNVSFNWIAVGRRAGYETRPEIPAELAAVDYDAHMREFAFNEGDMDGQAKPMWHDGVSLRWDTPPETPPSTDGIQDREGPAPEPVGLDPEQ